MRIAFDGTTLRPGRTGVGYYSEHLLRHVAEEAIGDEVIVISNGPVDTTTRLPHHVRVRTAGWRLPQLAWMQLQAPRLLRDLQVDVAHFTNGIVPLASSVTTVVTIHDMSLVLYPRCHPARRVLLNRPLMGLAARRADAIITVSESAKSDIVALYGLSSERVHVVHEAAAPAFEPVVDPAERERVRTRYALADRFILYVGTIEPRKNLPTLIEAFAACRHSGALPDHQLVCVGPYGWLERDIGQRIARLNIAESIRFTGYVPFTDLPALYSLAEMFVFPSIYEGFGLPVVEAMACGVPVITGRTSALAEVAGGAIQHVERLDAAAIGDALVRVATDPEHRAALSRRGLERARAFSWRRAARETLEIYQRAASQRAGVPALEPMPQP